MGISTCAGLVPYLKSVPLRRAPREEAIERSEERGSGEDKDKEDGDGDDGGVGVGGDKGHGELRCAFPVADSSPNTGALGQEGAECIKPETRNQNQNQNQD